MTKQITKEEAAKQALELVREMAPRAGQGAKAMSGFDYSRAFQIVASIKPPEDPLLREVRRLAHDWEQDVNASSSDLAEAALRRGMELGSERYDKLNAIVKRMQGVMAREIKPASSMSAVDIVLEMVGILDGPEMRAVQAGE